MYGTYILPPPEREKKRDIGGGARGASVQKHTEMCTHEKYVSLPPKSTRKENSPTALATLTTPPTLYILFEFKFFQRDF
jgi:hypothetical protein